MVPRREYHAHRAVLLRAVGQRADVFPVVPRADQCVEALFGEVRCRRVEIAFVIILPVGNDDPLVDKVKRRGCLLYTSISL